MAQRQAFVPPPDADDDVLDFLASGRPTAPPVPAAAPAPAPVAPPEPQLVTAPAPTQPAARLTRPARAASARRAPAPKAKPAAAAGLKRIGLYVDVPTWAQLKRISLQRAERGLEADFTSIVIEALQAQYPEGRWAKR